MSRPRLSPLEQVGAIAAMLHPEAGDLGVFSLPPAARLLDGPGLGMFDDGAPRQVVALLGEWDTVVTRGGWWAVFEASDAVWARILENSQRATTPRVRDAMRQPVPRAVLAQFVTWCASAPLPVIAHGRDVLDALLAAPTERVDRVDVALAIEAGRAA